MDLHNKQVEGLALNKLQNAGQQRKLTLNEEFLFATSNTEVHLLFVKNKCHFYSVWLANKTKQINFVAIAYNFFC